MARHAGRARGERLCVPVSATPGSLQRETRTQHGKRQEGAKGAPDKLCSRTGASLFQTERTKHPYVHMILCPRTQTAWRSQYRHHNDLRGERLCVDRWAPHGSEPGASVTPPAGLPPCPRQPVPPWSLRHCCQRACSLRLGGGNPTTSGGCSGPAELLALAAGGKASRRAVAQ